MRTIRIVTIRLPIPNSDSFKRFKSNFFSSIPMNNMMKSIKTYETLTFPLLSMWSTFVMIVWVITCYLILIIWTSNPSRLRCLLRNLKWIWNREILYDYLSIPLCLLIDTRDEKSSAKWGDLIIWYESYTLISAFQNIHTNNRRNITQMIVCNECKDTPLLLKDTFP